MHYRNLLSKVDWIYNKLEDKESKELFDARVDYMITGDEDKFYKVIDSLSGWKCMELGKILSETQTDKIIIYGCGHDGMRTKKTIEMCGYSLYAFCDNSKKKKEIDGVPVIDLEELLKDSERYVVVIGSRLYKQEMYASLVDNDFPRERVLIPQYGILLANRGIQYFDVFEQVENEVFIDAGAYDGDTTETFIDWTNRNYEQIYVFEPMPVMANKIKKKFEYRKDIQIFENAVWNKNEKLHFNENGAGSQTKENGKVSVEGKSIDSVTNGRRVTFIKMDIEGSELKALEGAKETIVKHAPRLAVCIYHKPWDVIEIAEYLLHLVPEYRFRIRHYVSNMWKTVLYAEVVKENGK